MIERLRHINWVSTEVEENSDQSKLHLQTVQKKIN